MVFDKLRRKVDLARGIDPDFEDYNEMLRELSVDQSELDVAIEFSVRYISGRIKTTYVERGLAIPIASMTLEVARTDGQQAPTKLTFPGSWGIQIGDIVKAYLDVACCCQREINKHGSPVPIRHYIARELQETERPYRLEIIRDGHKFANIVNRDRIPSLDELTDECEDHGYEFPEE